MKNSNTSTKKVSSFKPSGSEFAPPDPPSPSRDAWDLQFCKWWGWTWVPKKGFQCQTVQTYPIPEERSCQSVSRPHESCSYNSKPSMYSKQMRVEESNEYYTKERRRGCFPWRRRKRHVIPNKDPTAYSIHSIHNNTMPGSDSYRRSHQFKEHRQQQTSCTSFRCRRTPTGARTPTEDHTPNCASEDEDCCACCPCMQEEIFAYEGDIEYEPCPDQKTKIIQAEAIQKNCQCIQTDKLKPIILPRKRCACQHCITQTVPSVRDQQTEMRCRRTRPCKCSRTTGCIKRPMCNCCKCGDTNKNVPTGKKNKGLTPIANYCLVGNEFPNLAKIEKFSRTPLIGKPIELLVKNNKNIMRLLGTNYYNKTFKYPTATPINTSSPSLDTISHLSAIPESADHRTLLTKVGDAILSSKVDAKATASSSSSKSYIARLLSDKSLHDTLLRDTKNQCLQRVFKKYEMPQKLDKEAPKMEKLAPKSPNPSTPRMSDKIVDELLAVIDLTLSSDTMHKPELDE